MKCEPVCNHRIPKLSEQTMKLISNSTKLSEDELKYQSLDNQIKSATQKHNEFLKELGLPLLP